ncbi:MAG: hypothetical protein HN382_02205 [Gammaproteobacteria bacterium]|nr:hypothetical protein [Gammaproteobacteria bacterium]MBT4607760.1 hypothetical protein [Thiotrichales bacterium]MBT3473031.1 hypothetical protein [Gammaproteobacteria bacterium]MBT3968221.1 hypothetical protein [Gammaproteobacteria bacterium]MBT4080574.1 hypothetical protein [Gammaproteobacteria bacterium]
MKEIIDTADSLSTEELDKLILELANLRITKEPAISFNAPTVDDNTYGINIQDNPYIEATLLKDGRTRMWIRNGGLGWLILNLTNEQTITLRDYLNANTDSGSISVLFSEEHFDKGSPH